MDKKIIVLPRHKFEKMYAGLSPRQKKDIAFISIRDIEFPLIDQDANNFLNLAFDDIDEQVTNVDLPFNDDMAQQIYDFVLNNNDKNLFVIHCLMGVSRSGAVGGFIADYFGIKYEKFKRDNPQIIPNYLVKKLLNQKLYA